MGESDKGRRGLWHNGDDIKCTTANRVEISC